MLPILRNILGVSVSVALVAFAPGCGSNPTFEFDRMDLLPAEENLTEFSLGQYKIPIPVADEQGKGSLRHRNRVQFDFQLFALVSPKEETQLTEAWKRHEGMIRNEIITICRSASVSDLQEPELATLKARLTNVLAARLGENRLRQLLITDVASQEL
jgi:hypothetical protein